MLAYMGIPGIIQELESRGMKVRDIARVMDVAEGTVYQLRRGEYANITLDMLERLAHAYGAPSWKLLKLIREDQGAEPTPSGSKASAA